jgi:hypothetical protein
MTGHIHARSTLFIKPTLICTLKRVPTLFTSSSKRVPGQGSFYLFQSELDQQNIRLNVRNEPCDTFHLRYTRIALSAYEDVVRRMQGVVRTDNYDSGQLGFDHIPMARWRARTLEGNSDPWLGPHRSLRKRQSTVGGRSNLFRLMVARRRVRGDITDRTRSDCHTFPSGRIVTRLGGKRAETCRWNAGKGY